MGHVWDASGRNYMGVVVMGSDRRCLGTMSFVVCSGIGNSIEAIHAARVTAGGPVLVRIVDRPHAVRGTRHLPTHLELQYMTATALQGWDEAEAGAMRGVIAIAKLQSAKRTYEGEAKGGNRVCWALVHRPESAMECSAPA